MNFLSTLLLLLTATQSVKGPKSPTLLSVRQIHQAGRTAHLASHCIHSSCAPAGPCSRHLQAATAQQATFGSWICPSCNPERFLGSCNGWMALPRRCAGPALGRIPFWTILFPHTQPKCSVLPGTKARHWNKPSQSKAHHSQWESCAPQKWTQMFPVG